MDNLPQRYKETDKMSDLICGNYSLLLVMSRFGLPLGFGDRTVKEICTQNGVDYKTFLAVVNFIEEDHFRIEDDSEGLSVASLMSYLKQAHSYFLDFNLPESGLRQRIINIYGKSLNQKLLSLDAQSSMVTISGFVGRPDSAKKRGALQFFFVNGRYMKHPYFHKAIMQAYEQLIPAGDMPNYFVYFTLDPSSIDVNIHPTKTEIKFENEQPIWQILMAATREALAKSSAIPTIDFDVEDAIDIPVYNPVKKSEPSTYKAPKVQVDSSYNPFDTTSYKKPEFDWSKLYQGFENDRVAVQRESETFEDAPIEELPAEASDPEKLFTEVSNPCYQYKGRYIVTSLKSGLAIIDQHRAHVRILFDQYLSNIRQQQGVSQQVLFPEIVGDDVFIIAEYDKEAYGSLRFITSPFHVSNTGIITKIKPDPARTDSIFIASDNPYQQQVPYTLAYWEQEQQCFKNGYFPTDTIPGGILIRKIPKGSLLKAMISRPEKAAEDRIFLVENGTVKRY